MKDVRYQGWVQTQDLDLCWKPRNPAAAEAILRSKLPQTEQLSGTDQGFHAELLTQIARAESAQEKFTEAQGNLDAAERILKQEGQLFPVSAQLRWWIESARLQICRRTPSQARKLLSQAWDLSITSKEDSFTVDVAQTMALIEPLKQQEEWLRRAIEVAERSSQPTARRWLGGLYSSLGRKLFELRQFDGALAAYQKALPAYQALALEAEAYTAQWSVGRTLRQLNRFAEALAAQEELYEQRRGSDGPDGRLCEEIAECLHSLKKSEAAQPYFARAYQALSSKEWQSDGQPLHLKRLKELGRVD